MVYTYKFSVVRANTLLPIYLFSFLFNWSLWIGAAIPISNEQFLIRSNTQVCLMYYIILRCFKLMQYYGGCKLPILFVLIWDHKLTKFV